MKTLLAVAAVTLGAGIAPVERKCSSVAVLFPDAPEPAFVLDARAVDQAKLAAVDPGTIESAHVMCAPELYERFNIRAQRSGFVVFTAPGPSTQLRESLAKLEQLQERYFRDHGTFTDDLLVLGWSDETGRIEIRIAILDEGRRWAATGSHSYLATGSEVTVPKTEHHH